MSISYIMMSYIMIWVTLWYELHYDMSYIMIWVTLWYELHYDMMIWVTLWYELHYDISYIMIIFVSPRREGET